MVSSIGDNYRSLVGRLENQSFRGILILFFLGHIQKSIALCTGKVLEAQVSEIIIFLHREQNILFPFNADFRLSLSILEAVSANDAVFLGKLSLHKLFHSPVLFHIEGIALLVDILFSGFKVCGMEGEIRLLQPVLQMIAVRSLCCFFNVGRGYHFQATLPIGKRKLIESRFLFLKVHISFFRKSFSKAYRLQIILSLGKAVET